MKGLKRTILLTFAGVLLLSTVHAAGYTVDQTEDYKAMGYTDAKKIVRDGNGNLYVTYRKKYNGTYQIFVAKSTNNGISWNITNNGRPISEVTGGCHQRVASIAIDSNNHLHVVWYGTDSQYNGEDERQIKYSKSTDGGTSWAGWKNIAPVSGYNGEHLWQEHPVIYIDESDHLYVVWEGRDSQHDSQQTKFTMSTDGGNSWTPWKNVKSRSTNQSRPTLVVDELIGDIYILAYGYWNGEQNILWTRSSDGGNSFSGWSAVSASSYDQRHPSIAIDSGGKIHLVWRQENASGQSEIKYSKYINRAWKAPVTIGASTGYYQFFPSISNYGGDQHVVWTETLSSSGFPSENPSRGKIVYAQRNCSTCSWSKNDVTSYGSHIFGSIRWSYAHMNGGNIDVIYLSGSSRPYDIEYTNLGRY